MKFFRPFIAGICIALSLSACGNPSSSDPSPSESASPLFGGNYDDGEKRVACYWEGETRHSLGAGLEYESWASSQVLSLDGIVYAAGFYSDGSRSVPCYWADGVRVDLGDESGSALTCSAYALGIALHEGEVYTVGVLGGTSEKPYNTPCYWKGSVCAILGNQEGMPLSQNGFAFSIAVASDDTVYTAGYSSGKSGILPCYWEGVERHYLAIPDGEDSLYGHATAIALSGGSVYAAGYYRTDGKTYGCYWKDRVRFDLHSTTSGDDSFPFGLEIEAIAVSGDTVYVGGSYRVDNRTELPGYWANRDLHALPLPASAGSEVVIGAIQVIGGKVYSAGSDFGGNAFYWEGDTVHALGDGLIEVEIPCVESPFWT